MRPLLFALAVCLTLPAPVLAQEGHGEPLEGERLILQPTARDTIFTVEGIYPQPPTDTVCGFKGRSPLLAKYRGALEVVRGSDGDLRLVNELSFSHYLRGLAEVPLTWPTATLRAQVIAARSYGMDAYLRGRSSAGDRGYHICATDQCQVYRGATIELGPFGERWVDAVRATKGRVLRYEGRVIQAFYFSTSTGRTRSSFPGGTPQPWLPSVDAHDDNAPLADWRAPIPIGQLSRILATAEGERAALWPGGRITAVRDAGDDVRITGAAAVTVSKSSMRSHLNAFASCLYPDTYPNPTGSQSGGRLPLTVPSSTYDVEQASGRRVVLHGAGWGHDVGMSQYGAQALAERGWNARRILGHYYGPARIERIREPRSLRVLAAEGMRRVRISIDGGVQVLTSSGGELAAGDRFEIRGGDRLRIRRGVGPRLRDVLSVRPRRTELRGSPGERLRLPLVLEHSARVTVDVEGPDGLITAGRERSYESGRARVPIEVPSALAPGTYTLVLRATDGLDRVREEITLVVEGEPLAGAIPDTAGGGGRGWLIALAAGVLAIGLGGMRLARRLSRR